MAEFKDLIWDGFNKKHIKKHDVTPEEVEETCSNKFTTRETHKQRILLTGITKSGRAISTVLANKGQNTWYPVTARPASRKERQYYQLILREEAA